VGISFFREGLWRPFFGSVFPRCFFRIGLKVCDIYSKHPSWKERCFEYTYHILLTRFRKDIPEKHLKREFMRCLRLKNEKISKSIADMQIIRFLGKNIRLRLLFLIIRFITRLRFILEFEVEVEKFISFLVTFFKKTPKFSTFFFKYIKKKVDNERFEYDI